MHVVCKSFVHLTAWGYFGKRSSTIDILCIFLDQAFQDKKKRKELGSWNKKNINKDKNFTHRYTNLWEYQFEFCSIFTDIPWNRRPLVTIQLRTRSPKLAWCVYEHVEQNSSKKIIETRHKGCQDTTRITTLGSLFLFYFCIFLFCSDMYLKGKP